jgi:electron transfer flavoprotein alpha subunit
MNYIVLVKQVPDIKNIPEEAWDWEKGILKRGLLDNVLNELDKQAVAFTLKMREKMNGKVVCLTMGPPFADEILRLSIAYGADEGVLMTDRKLGGADTAATAYPLAQAILKIEKDFFAGDKNYIITSGMQSVDGDTAQVPPQVAEELHIPHIAYATAMEMKDNHFYISRITGSGTQTVSPVSYPCMITVTNWTLPPNAGFSRTRLAASKKISVWSAADVGTQDARIGLNGSRTTVFKIFSPKEVSTKNCQTVSDLSTLPSLLKSAYENKKQAAASSSKKAGYKIPEGRKISYDGEIWVFGEMEKGDLNPATFELLGKASELAGQIGVKTGIVLVGNASLKTHRDLIAGGADKVYAIEHELLNEFIPTLYTKAIVGLLEKYRPQTMVFCATPMGRELAPRVACRFMCGLTADCTGLEIIDLKRGANDLVGILKQTRPALGGNIMASIVTQNSKVQMSTVRPGVMQALKPDEKRTGEVVKYVPELTEAEAGVKIISNEAKPQVAGLSEATVIVSGGGGCKTKEGFNTCIPNLADSLGKFLGEKSMVGATRVAVEMGFIDRSHQVGQTGQTVKPKVYVAVGISGAVQHVTGMQNSDIVIAINKDGNAPIFKVADFAIIGDYAEIVPQLVKALNTQTGGKNQ